MNIKEHIKRLIAMKPATTADVFKLQNMAQIKPEFKPQYFIDTDHLPGSLLTGFDVFKRGKKAPLKDRHLSINKYGRCILNKNAIDRYGLHIFKTCNFYAKDSNTIGLVFISGSKGEIKITWSGSPIQYSYFQVGRRFIADKNITGRFYFAKTNYTINGELEVLLKRKGK